MNQHLVILSLLSLLFFGGIYATKREGSKGPKTVEFCNIYAHPEKYAGRKIKFIAYYQEGFMVYPVLFDPRCEGQLIDVSTADTEESSKIRDEIKSGIKDIDGGITSRGKFTFVGFLKKNSLRGRSAPIEGLLEDYSMIIESAAVQEKENDIKK